jgi:hypothetical protein
MLTKAKSKKEMNFKPEKLLIDKLKRMLDLILEEALDLSI